MPQATTELREEWGDDTTAMNFLRRRGYKLTHRWSWKKPFMQHVPTPEERRAAEYLVQEWDFDGIEGA